MARDRRKKGPAVAANELKAAEQEQRELWAKADVEKRRAILRQVRAGLSDNQVAQRLGVQKRMVTACREQARMESNPNGGALD